MGIVDFAEIRPHCTEVTLAVHYEIKNKLFAWLDRRLHFVDSFVNVELRSIRAHFEGIRSSYVERPRVMPVLPSRSRLTKRRCHRNVPNQGFGPLGSGSAHGAFTVEAQDLARVEGDFRFGIANFGSINFHASLFDQSRDFAVRFFRLEHFAIHVRHDSDGREDLVAHPVKRPADRRSSGRVC